MMIKLESRRLNADDCKKLARLNISVRKDTPLETKRSVVDIAKSIEGLSNNDGFHIIVASDEMGNIVGWTYYYVAFPLMTFISGFYPVVEQTERSEEIAQGLIKASKKEVLERGHTRLEIELVFPSDEHRTYSEKLVDLYKQCDFQFAAEEVHMKCDLMGIELPAIELPMDYTVRKFSDASYDDLEGPGFDTLRDSQEGLFLSMSPAEQKVTIEYFFDKGRPWIEDASLVLEKENEIVGFVITRWNDDDKPEIGPVGLVPDKRGKGLASYLLVRVMESLKDGGSTAVYLDTTVTNHPAQKLYRKYGFEDVYYKQFYYWSP
ncbi:MAG: GNAT family N-acetyltransferase [Promethearchaeota archaeon]